jgi:hypothetical protein
LRESLGKSLKYKVGDKIRDWTIISVEDDGSIKYVIKCKCGQLKVVASNKLSKQTSCRSCIAKQDCITLVGTYLNNFYILSYGKDGRKRTYEARCKCGNIIFATRYSLKTNKGCRACNRSHFPGKVIDGCTLLERINGLNWKMKCHCGKIYIKNLRSSANADCGCVVDAEIMKKAREKIGMKFGKLKVIDVEPGFRHLQLVCKCKCGNIVKFNNGHECKKKSCGCLLKDNNPRYERKGNARFKNHEIIALRELYQSGLYLKEDLAKMYEVSLNYISRILGNHIWKDLK